MNIRDKLLILRLGLKGLGGTSLSSALTSSPIAPLDATALVELTDDILDDLKEEESTRQYLSETTAAAGLH